MDREPRFHVGQHVCVHTDEAWRAEVAGRTGVVAQPPTEVTQHFPWPSYFREERGIPSPTRVYWVELDGVPSVGTTDAIEADENELEPI